ncbi:MAG: NTP transferase domain-containing protein [Sphaerochaetaceae bacterium]
METVLLAAGTATRMGGAIKLLLPYEGEALIIHALKAALEGSESVIVVTGAHHREIETALGPLCQTFPTRIRMVRNGHYEEGQFSSTQCGVEQVTPGKDFAIAVADLPLITERHYHQLEALLDGYEAVRPYCQGIPGHPVLCAAFLRDIILALPPTATMRGLLLGKKVLCLESADVAWKTDIDTPEAYRQLVNPC